MTAFTRSIPRLGALLALSGCTRTVVLPPTEAARLSRSHDAQGGGELLVTTADGGEEDVALDFEQMSAEPLPGFVFAVRPGDPTTAVALPRRELRHHRGWRRATTELPSPSRVEIVGDEVLVTYLPDPASRVPRTMRYRTVELRGVGVETPDYTVPVVLGVTGGVLVVGAAIGTAIVANGLSGL